MLDWWLIGYCRRSFFQLSHFLFRTKNVICCPLKMKRDAIVHRNGCHKFWSHFHIWQVGIPHLPHLVLHLPSTLPHHHHHHLLPFPEPPPTLPLRLKSFASPRHCPYFAKLHNFGQDCISLLFTTCAWSVCSKQSNSFIGCVLFPKCPNVDQRGPTSLLCIIDQLRSPFPSIKQSFILQTNGRVQLLMTHSKS